MKSHVEQLEQRQNAGRRAYILNVLTTLGVPFRVQPVRRAWRKGENIIVDYPFGASPEGSTPRTLLTAHSDCWRSPGANDNASGVAVLLEFLQRLTRDRPATRPLRFTFFDGEEGIGPLFAIGSKQYLRDFGVRNVAALYNLEMVGMGSVLLLWPATEHDAGAGWLQPLAAQARRQGFSLVTHALPRVALAPKVSRLGFASDHVPFVAAGCRRACSLTVVPAEDLRFRSVLEGRGATRLGLSLVRYWLTRRGDIPKLLQHYHTADDRAEFVEERTLERVLQTLWGTVVRPAGS